MAARTSSTKLARALLPWYARHKRDLAWRRTRDPYKIWISEVMLQQTQVATVLPYYDRWLKAFPTVEALARAPQDRVLKVWEGLGYYARARNLQRAARDIVSRHAGKFPRRLEAIRSLPGIGPYTAGAIASIAFNQRAPVLDGNVTRVLTRLAADSSDVTRPETRRRLESLELSLIPEGKARDFNQALMELGATVCLPRRPLCPVCPASSLCKAYGSGQVTQFPFKPGRKPVPHYTATVAVVFQDGKVLIQKRLNKGLLAGLWEFPGGKRDGRETLEACIRREMKEECALRVRIVRKLGTIDHAYTHFKVTLHVFLCEHVSGRARPLESQAVRWVHPRELRRYPFPTANKRIIPWVLSVSSQQ